LKPSAIGLDGPDRDLPDAHGFPVHDALLPRGILIVENLANLGVSKSETFEFIGLSLKIGDGTGSPMRAMAVVD